MKGHHSRSSRGNVVAGSPGNHGSRGTRRGRRKAAFIASGAIFVIALLFLRSRWPDSAGPPITLDQRNADQVVSRQSRPAPQNPLLDAAEEFWASPLPAAWTEDFLYRGLEQLSKRILADFPTRPEAMAVGAMERAFRGKSAEAEEFWKKAASLDANYPEAYFGLAQLARQRGDFEEAVRLARRTCSLDPSHDEAARFLADSLLNLGEVDEALEVLKINLRANPFSAVSYFLLGQSYLQKQAFHDAREAFQQAVTLSPRYTHAYYGLATACERLGDADSARSHRERFNALKQQEQDSERVLMRDPKALPLLRRGAASIYATAGNVYLRHGKPNMAEAIWRRGLQCDPQGLRCREALARFYERQMRPAEALAMYQELHAMAPDDPGYELGVAQQQMRLDQVAAAEKRLLALCQRLPQWSRPAAALAQLYLHTGRGREETLRWALRALELEPVAAHYYLLGMVHERSGSREQALAALRRAVELEPDNQPCREAYEALRNRP